jgi:hypothetical protein
LAGVELHIHQRHAGLGRCQQRLAGFPAPVHGHLVLAALANTWRAPTWTRAEPEINSTSTSTWVSRVSGWHQLYLGLDGNAPANTINFAVVLMHEVGHGLGFQALTSGSSGRASAMA